MTAYKPEGRTKTTQENFNPDFFIKKGDDIIVVEIKKDNDERQASDRGTAENGPNAFGRSRKMKGIEKGSINVYADLGMADAEEMLGKAQLAVKIAEIIKQKRLTQRQAAELLDMSQPKLSNMLRGQFCGISETKMLDCLTRLGLDVQADNISSRPRRPGRQPRL